MTFDNGFAFLPLFYETRPLQALDVHLLLCFLFRFLCLELFKLMLRTSFLSFLLFLQINLFVALIVDIVIAVTYIIVFATFFTDIIFLCIILVGITAVDIVFIPLLLLLTVKDNYRFDQISTRKENTH